MSKNINVVGDYKKSGLTSKELQNIVKAVFDVLDPHLSSRAERSGAEGSLKGNLDGRGFLRIRSDGHRSVGRNDPRTIKCGASKVINIAFVDAEEIKEKNLEYRKIDKPTDVLSFDYEDEGDILLCVDKIDEYKDEDSLTDSVTKTLIHGVLHLFGYDHENDKDHAIMDEIANKVFRRLS